MRAKATDQGVLLAKQVRWVEAAAETHHTP